MTTALVCLMKNEDRHFEEWIGYHLSIGFDKVIVMCNDWDPGDNQFSGDCRVLFFRANGEKVQVKAYTTMFRAIKDSYDFIMFLDADEFLYLNKHNNVKELFAEYEDEYAVSFNQLEFGNSGKEHINEFKYSLVKEFNHCKKEIDKHVKTAYNAKRLRSTWIFDALSKKSRNLAEEAIIGPHVFEVRDKLEVICSTTANKKAGLFYCVYKPKEDDDVPLVYHYKWKTLDEWNERIGRGDAFYGSKDTIDKLVEDKKFKRETYKGDANELENNKLIDWINSRRDASRVLPNA